eukprot:gene9889-4090_t
MELLKENLRTWAQEKGQEMQWDEFMLTHSARKRYGTDVLDMVDWLPFTRRRRGVAYPTKAGSGGCNHVW